jgi:hypothetical protein
VVKNKQKYKENQMTGGIDPILEENDDDKLPLNIMYDKRVFRGNTHNLNLIKANMTPS